MEVLYDKVLGIDVHQAMLACCIVECKNGETVTTKRTFRTFGQDLHEMARWAKSENVDLVIMESTGIYWRTPYQVLEKVGIMSAVVNARQIKQMEGKKTDMADAEWLAHVGRLGVFCKSFIPALRYRQLRVTSREAMKLTDTLVAEKNRFGKILNDCGYRLNVVFSDIFGVNATKVIDALIEGKSPDEIMGLINLNQLSKTPEEIRAALDGEMSDCHRFTLDRSRKIIRFLEKTIEDTKRFILAKVEELHPLSLKLLQTIPGISQESAVHLLIELGGEDLTAFGRADRLASWLGVCPGNNESAGKRKSGKTRKGNYYLRRILCECANGAARSKGTTFQSKMESLRVRKIYKQALIAIVHKVVRCIFYVLKNKKPYVDPKIDYQEASAKKNAQRWVNMLCKLEDWNIEATNLKSMRTYKSQKTTV